jgi:hypothetical protein
MEELKSRPCVILECKHIYDLDCLFSRLQSKWNSAQVDFNYLSCWCNTPINCDHDEIEQIVNEDRKVQKEAEEVAIKAAKHDGLDKNTEDYANAPFNGNFEEYAIHKMAVYQCYECKKPYPAGLKE